MIQGQKDHNLGTNGSKVMSEILFEICFVGGATEMNGLTPNLMPGCLGLSSVGCHRLA